MTVVYAIEDVFSCPACNGRRIVEVLVEAVVTTEVVSIDKFGCMTYGEPDVQSGDVEQFQCMECGLITGKDDLLASVGCADPPDDASSVNQEG
jgi:DNA-directed RNA polymerase subunit RPC12/RpoP